MTDPINPPAPNPCSSCPYRTDVPSGVWSATEYEKLREYDNPTPLQPTGVFQCHQNDKDSDKARMCAGWVACHGENLLALRLHVGLHGGDPAVFDYTTPVEVFESGNEAANYGEWDIEDPSPEACALIEKITRTRTDVELA